MSKRFENYFDAHSYALELAKTLGRETGIEKAKEFGRHGFNVHHLPNPENRSGFELKCEIVRPMDPRGEAHTVTLPSGESFSFNGSNEPPTHTFNGSTLVRIK